MLIIRTIITSFSNSPGPNLLYPYFTPDSTYSNFVCVFRHINHIGHTGHIVIGKQLYRCGINKHMNTAGRFTDRAKRAASFTLQMVKGMGDQILFRQALSLRLQEPSPFHYS